MQIVMPSLLLSNVNRLYNKMDEISIIVTDLMPDIIVFTETWLDGTIPDSVVSLSSYSVFRKDRKTGLGGGVIIYARDEMQVVKLDGILEDSGAFEILFVMLRPFHLPREISGIVVGAIYFPPWYSVGMNNDMCSYIVRSVDKLKRKYPNAGFLLTGDFNQVKTDMFNKHLCMKQLVKSPTRNANILDKIFSNCSSFYNVPIVLPPIGRSDHNRVFLSSTGLTKSPANHTVFTKRKVNFDALSRIGHDLNLVRWHEMYRLYDCQAQADFFYGTITEIADRHAPVVTIRRRTNDKPWVNSYFTKLIAQRDSAWKTKDMVLYRKLRNRVNRMRLGLRTQYYSDKVCTLKDTDSSGWWREVKKLCGWTDGDSSACLDNLTDGDVVVDRFSLPDAFNTFLVSITSHIPSLNLQRFNIICDKLKTDCIADDFIVSELSVFKALKRAKPSISVCDDFLSNRMLNEFADILAGPICGLVNSSIREGYVPTQWKVSRVCPLPKIKPPISLRTDLRPISVTTSISKIAEFFIRQYFNEHFRTLIDDNQFGCTTNRSTTHALLKVGHILFQASDCSNNFIRILFVDFMKAFDLVDNNVLLCKFLNYDFPLPVTAWSLSFLHDRTQFVKVGNNVSRTVSTHAGTPQGTLSGPNDYKLLINDLRFSIPYVKYVDDTTAISVSDDPWDDALQTEVGHLIEYCGTNGMHINPNKTKEMVVHFGKIFSKSSVPLLYIGDDVVERVECFKLLGVYFNSDLSWKDHVSFMLAKVAKRIFIIHQLARIGASVRDIIVVYCALIRSVLEYACPVWHCGLTVSQSVDLERVQKRILRIVLPDLSYRQALIATGLERLGVRRERFVREIFDEIKDPNHVLYSLLPFNVNVNPSKRPTRSSYPLKLPQAKTQRLFHSFIYYCIRKKY